MVLICSTTLLSACGASSSSSITTGTTQADVATIQVVDNTVVPAINAFQVQSQQLDDSAELFCSAANTNLDNLNALQLEWKNTLLSWYQVLPFLAGPLSVKDFLGAPAYAYIDSYRQKGNLDSSVIRSDISAMLNSSTALTDTNFETKNFNKVGLLALELIMFDEPISEESSDQSQGLSNIVNEFIATPRKCDILTGYSADLLRRATLIQQAWNNDYRDKGVSYRGMLANNSFSDYFDGLDDDGNDQSAFSRITVSVQDHFDFLANRNASSDVAVVSNSLFIGLAWDAIWQSIDSSEALLMGDDNSTLTLFNLMDNKGFASSTLLIKNNLQTLRDTVTAQNSTDFKAAAAEVDGNFKREIPNALDISLGLNFNDGD